MTKKKKEKRKIVNDFMSTEIKYNPFNKKIKTFYATNVLSIFR